MNHIDMVNKTSSSELREIKKSIFNKLFPQLNSIQQSKFLLYIEITRELALRELEV